MSDRGRDNQVLALEAEIRRLVKVNTVLLHQVERHMNSEQSSFALFKSAGLLEKKVEERTVSLRAANERLETEVHQRQQAQAEVERTLSLNRATLESTADGILVVDGNGGVVDFNTKFAALWRLPRDLLASHDDHRYIDFVLDQVEDPDEFRRKIDELYHNADAESLDEIRCADGRVFERYSQPHREGARAIGRVWSFRDVSERYRVAGELERAKLAAEDAARAKSEFLANMSHEIRTPLNGIVGTYQLLAGTSLTDEQTEYVETGLRSTQSLMAIVNDILDFSKIEAGKLTLDVAEFDPITAVEDVLELLAPLASQKGLELAYEILEDVPARVSGDAGRLRQILTNLTGNAVKFTDSGTIVVRASVPAKGTATVTIRFDVTDSGIGISADDQRHLFSPFEQVDGSMTRRLSGTGLGLVISKKLAELMGGEIGLRSVVGSGSTFWFTIACDIAHGQAPPIMWRPSPTGARVLVVEHAMLASPMVSRYLKRLGATCEVVTNVNDALASLARAADHKIDLAVLDWQTCAPLDGMRRLGASLGTTPVAVLAPRGDHEVAEWIAAHPHTSHLSKPLRRSQVIASVASLLGLAKAEVAPRRQPRSATQPQSGRPLRILLAEDNAVNQLIASKLLQKDGHAVDIVSNGRKAIDALIATSYDIVLMDVNMPEMDGLQATVMIRDVTSPVRQHDIPVIALTAFAMSGDRDRCLAAGMNDYASKPITRDELNAAIQRCLAGPVRAEDEPAA